MKYLIRKKYKLIYLFNKMFKEKFDKKLEFDWSKSSKRFTIKSELKSKSSSKVIDKTAARCAPSNSEQ